MSGGWGLTTLKVLVSVSLLVLLLRRFSFEELKRQVLQTDPLLLLVPFTVLVLSNLLGAVQWGWILHRIGLVVRWVRVVPLYFTGLFFNNFLVGNIGGDLYKIYSLGKEEKALGRVASATIVDRVLGVTALSALACVAAVFMKVLGEIGWLTLAVVLVFALALMLVLGLFLDARHSHRLEAWLRRFLGQSLSARVENLFRHLNSFRQRQRFLNNVFLLSIVIQSARVLAHFFVGIAMGWPLGMAELAKFFLVIPVLGLIIALPISIGGWGLREWAGVVLWTPLGRDGEEAVTLLALTASLTFLVSLSGGFVFLLRSLRRSPIPA